MVTHNAFYCPVVRHKVFDVPQRNSHKACVALLLRYVGTRIHCALINAISVLFYVELRYKHKVIMWITPEV